MEETPMAPPAMFFDPTDSQAWDVTGEDVARLRLESAGPVDADAHKRSASEDDLAPQVGGFSWLIVGLAVLALSGISPARAQADPEAGAPRFPVQVAFNAPASSYVNEGESRAEWRYESPATELEGSESAEVRVLPAAPAVHYEFGGGDLRELRPRGVWANPGDPMGVGVLRLPCARH